jgi:SAM-dependent methyltransferase
MNRTIIDYYDRLADRYDADRFGNSYGQFIDAQERRLLDRLPPKNGARILDVGCGTGRLTGHASVGCDASIRSVAVAAKNGAAPFTACDAKRLPFAGQAFDAALSFHVFMHLERDEIGAVFKEVARVLKPGGVFVADVASAARRRINGKTDTKTDGGWHGATALSAQEFAACGAAAGFRLDALAGIMLLPVHRLPHFLRQSLVSADLAAAALYPELASYLVGRFVKDDPP